MLLTFFGHHVTNATDLTPTDLAFASPLQRPPPTPFVSVLALLWASTPTPTPPPPRIRIVPPQPPLLYILLIKRQKSPPSSSLFITRSENENILSFQPHPMNNHTTYTHPPHLHPQPPIPRLTPLLPPTLPTLSHTHTPLPTLIPLSPPQCPSHYYLHLHP